MKHSVLSLIFAFIFSVTASIANGQEPSFRTFTDDDIASSYKHLSTQQLLDTAFYYYAWNQTDKALACYNLLAEVTSQSSDVKDQQREIEAYNRIALIHTHIGNYRIAYESALNALQKSEAANSVTYLSRIYATIGNIYLNLDKHDLAELHYRESLKHSSDSTTISHILNNIGYSRVKAGNLDSALHILTQSLDIMKRHEDFYLHLVLHSIAKYYEKKEINDSAFLYYHLALEDAKKDNRADMKAHCLLDMGKLFFKINEPDSALFYINQSKILASENELRGILMKCYLALSEIAKSKGQTGIAFKYSEQYINLKDSILNHGKIVEIIEIRRLFETSKMTSQIEQLTIERRMKEQTIRYQLIILILISIVLILVFIQNRRLNAAHKKLLERSVEIIELQENSVENHTKKHQKSILSDSMQNEFLSRIYTLMDDVSVVCDPELSVEKMADLLHSNRAYVSMVINEGLNKHFRTFINEYRIREAQRLLSEMDVSKHTLEFIAQKTGFKSRNTFTIVFKEIIGVSPSFYLKSMKKQ
jgi:AraC-like DNA-binding protein/Tfp pilus assembly protein PilF